METPMMPNEPYAGTTDEEHQQFSIIITDPRAIAFLYWKKAQQRDHAKPWNEADVIEWALLQGYTAMMHKYNAGATR